MAKTHETIADIIAWLRRTREGENAYLTLWRDEIADRLDAAHRRERGDCAKLREALEKIRVIAKTFMDATQMRRATDSARIDIGDIKYLADAALAAPPRNCDKYPTFNDAIRALADKRGWHDAKWDSERYCILAQWLYAPATEQEGETK